MCAGVTRHMQWKEDRIAYFFGGTKFTQSATIVASDLGKDMSRSDVRMLVGLLADPVYSRRAFAILMMQDHAKIFPYLLNVLDNPLKCTVPDDIVRLIGKEGRKEYVNRPLARKKLRALIKNGTAVRDSIAALGVVGMPADIQLIKAVEQKGKEFEAIKRIACARLGDAESMILTAKYLAAHGAVPVEQWHPTEGCVIGPPPKRDIPYAEYIDTKEFHRYYGQAVRELNPESLIIGWSPISDFTFLEGLRIRHLQISTSQTFNLEFTKHLPLETLEISFTSISDLSPLTGSNLKTLNLASCKRITSIEPLRGLALTKLVLFGTGITDLSPLKGMPLELIELGCTKVADLSPLKGAPLQELWIFNNPSISDLSPFEGAPLKILSAGGTSVEDLTPVRNCPLKHVSIDGTRVTDLRPIAHMDLDYLKVTEGNIKYGLDFVERVTAKMKKARKYD